MPELRRKKCEESLDFIIVFLIFAISILLIKDAKNLMMSLLIMIKNWITGLGLWDKIVGGIMSFVTGGALKKFCNKFKSTEEEKAFKRAVKRWNSSFYIRGYYKKNKVKTINEFCEYVIGHHGVYDDDIDTLYRLFEEELQKTHEGREFLQSIRIKSMNKDQYDSLMKTNDILNEQKKLHEMLAEIKQELCTHNKGIREFTAVDGYIQRYCTLRLKSDEYFKYYWEHKGIKRYNLADIVAGRTDCKGRKFVLYSDAQTGKTTELLRLGWELQEEGRLVPIMFKVRGNQSIKQELPALRPDIEKGLVVIVDALDEKFDGDARFGLYHEIETYAEEHPQLRIVMTCRENFSSEYKFEGFTELNLNDLTWQDSEDYLVSKNLGNIVDEIKKRKLYEFVRTPFYLIAMADYYNEKKTLPDNKGELYEYFIDRRLAQEEKLSLKQNTEMLTTVHHDVNVDDDLLLRLLPYSSSSIYIQGNGFGGRNYSLFDYISERCGGQTTFLTALRECMDRPTEYADRNWQEWCVYLVKQGATSEYQRTIDMMLSLPCASPSLRIAEVLLENEETRPMVLKNDVLTRCDMEKKLYIFERLALDATMDDFVREGVEKDFDNMDDGNKNRAARILLMKGSIKGLEYAEQNPSVLRIRADVRNYAIEALPLLMSVYSKAMEKEHQSDYSGILKAVEVIAEDTDEGWEKVNQLFERLIQQDSKKFQHLNWYLRDWMVKRMEKASPVMSLEKVKEMLAA